ncbi:HipA domain-containing protein [Actinotalea sp. C106]|uniref:HipA domain-containing protein n=1 Tax=Actinotalea sp. C106 TaxID=2908644 RepID=UPI0020280E08|nr:HipA domain-containing protein [Actinotalea sp. C106]
MSTPLAVILDGAVVAEVERTRAGAVRLVYRDGAGPTPLSLSMPVEVGIHTGRVVERYLQGLLPDSPGARAAIAREHGVSGDDPLSLLSAVGLDCAGAAQFCAPERVESALARAGHLEPVSDGEVEARLGALEMDEDAAWAMPGEHWSLGGAQAKFTLHRARDQWFVAHGAIPSTHIVKPGVRRVALQALVEHVSMRAAEFVGLDVARTDYTSFKSHDAIVITRFDRTVGAEGALLRLHQEDLCQATGTEAKYEEYGGLGAVDVTTALRDLSPTAARARQNVTAFVDALTFNTVIGAPDAHARNYAVLLDGADVRLAPMYDVASGAAYAPAPGRPAVASMSVGGELAFDQITSESWLRLGAEVGLDPQGVLDRARELAAVVPSAFERALDEAAEAGHGEAAAQLRDRLIGPLTARATGVVARAG